MDKPKINKKKLNKMVSAIETPEQEETTPTLELSDFKFPKYREEIIFKIINTWQINKRFAGRIMVIHGEIGVGLTAVVDTAIQVIKQNLSPQQQFINLSGENEEIANSLRITNNKLQNSANNLNRIAKDVIFIDNFDNSLRQEINSNKSVSPTFDSLLEMRPVANFILTVRTSSLGILKNHPLFQYMDLIEVPRLTKQQIIDIAADVIRSIKIHENKTMVKAGVTEEKILNLFKQIIINNVIPDYYNIKKVMRVITSFYIKFAESKEDLNKLDTEVCHEYEDNMIRAASLLSKLSPEEIKRVIQFDYSPQQISKFLDENIILSEKNKRAVTSIITRKHLNISLDNKPVASAILTGPTGTGKTETAKVIARLAFGDPDRLVIIDMSKYKHQHNTTDFIGSSPGYVGYNTETLFQKQHRERTPCVVLFDEVEKAHPTILDLLIPLLDEGRLPLADGSVMDFSNDIILMTTNISVGLFERKNRMLGFQTEEEKNEPKVPTIREIKEDMIRQNFKPELLGRIENLLVYSKLSDESLRKIIDIQFDRIINQSFKNIEIKFKDVDKIKDHIFEKVNREDGGRAIRKYIMNVLVPSIIDKLALGSNTISVDDIDEEYNTET